MRPRRSPQNSVGWHLTPVTWTTASSKISPHITLARRFHFRYLEFSLHAKIVIIYAVAQEEWVSSEGVGAWPLPPRPSILFGRLCPTATIVKVFRNRRPQTHNNWLPGCVFWRLSKNAATTLDSLSGYLDRRENESVDWWVPMSRNKARKSRRDKNNETDRQCGKNWWFTSPKWTNKETIRFLFGSAERTWKTHFICCPLNRWEIFETGTRKDRPQPPNPGVSAPAALSPRNRPVLIPLRMARSGSANGRHRQLVRRNGTRSVRRKFGAFRRKSKISSDTFTFRSRQTIDWFTLKKTCRLVSVSKEIFPERGFLFSR